MAAGERAHHAYLRSGDPAGAARCAFWLALVLLTRGEHGRGGGWAARARRVLDDVDLDCVERGYLLELSNLEQDDASAAYATSTRAVEIGQRFADHDLLAFSRIGQGEALIRLGARARALSLLDEVLVAVAAGEVSPPMAGLVSCAAIDACREVFDLRRAREWTTALTHWCAAQPDLVPYRGQCLVHRAEIMQLHGAWQDALDAAREACERFQAGAAHPALGGASYRLGELHRLRGELTEAEDAYRDAVRRGHEAQPGLALLRLAQGRVEPAAAAIRRALTEAGAGSARARLLPAYVEIMLAARDVPAARAGADELTGIAEQADAAVLNAEAAQAAGAVLLAEGQPRPALETLRRAWRLWHRLDAPYEAARARLLLGSACRELGDGDSAEMEVDAARWVFQQLGAVPDLARLTVRQAPGGLTAREVEVLCLVAAGRSNRAIAADLFLSEHTVARHVQNIFAKLHVTSRTAAAAFAFEHGLADGRGGKSPSAPSRDW